MKDYLADLPSDQSDPIYAAFADIRARGLDGSAVTSRHIEGKLWELKFTMDRIFYVVLTGPEMVLLHAYKKQGQKSPLREIQTARKRLYNLL